MKFKDRFYLIKHKIFNKRNIILFIVMGLLVSIIFSCITLIYFTIDYQKSITNSELGRTIYIFDNKNYDIVKNIKHIILIDSNKYLSSGEYETKEYDVNGNSGLINLKVKFPNTKLTIAKGTNTLKSGEAICPVKFYPHSIYDDNYNLRLINSQFINGNKEIGKSFSVKSYNSKYQEQLINFQIVGSYLSSEFETYNTCYITKEDMDKIISETSRCESSVTSEGKTIENCYGYEDLFVVVDNIKNIEQVKKDLKNNNISYTLVFTIDKELLNFFSILSILVGLIVIIICINILYNYINKKIKSNTHNIGIYKACGYQNKDIIVNLSIENSLIYLISSIISLIIFLILYFITINTIFIEFTFNNYNIPIPILSFLILEIFFFGIIILSIKSCLKRVLTKPVQDLLESK